MNATIIVNGEKSVLEQNLNPWVAVTPTPVTIKVDSDKSVLDQELYPRQDINLQTVTPPVAQAPAPTPEPEEEETEEKEFIPDPLEEITNE